MGRGEEHQHARILLRGGCSRGREVEYCFLGPRVLCGGRKGGQSVAGMDGNAPVVELEQRRARNVGHRLHRIGRILRSFASREPMNRVATQR